MNLLSNLLDSLVPERRLLRRQLPVEDEVVRALAERDKAVEGAEQTAKNLHHESSGFHAVMSGLVSRDPKDQA